MVSNKLSLNIHKTKYMLFHKTLKHVPHQHLQINNNEISHVKPFNFLGLQMNDNLKWNTHIDCLKNVSHNWLTQSYETDIHTMIFNAIYNTLILPQLNYYILSWGKYCEPTTLLQFQLWCVPKSFSS